ncbi:di-heme oxidoredictase family protein [Maritalea sp.]|uniref:di-heme oxidoreductase family protein n=1 Tax=Maritalea sp. TaxID=2003361 RepID=UPI003EF9F7AA
MNRSILAWVATFPLLLGLAVAQENNFARDDLSPKDRSRVEQVTAPTDDFSKAERFENMQGGNATSRKLVSKDSFSQFSANLTFEEEEQFKLGNAFFDKLWVSSPASTFASDGLGPLFNARACQSCHLKDGRGHPPANVQDSRISMFLRLSVPPRTEEEKAKISSGEVQVIEEPTYGRQLQDLAVPGLPAEGKMQIAYEEVPVTLGDGTIINLRKPTYSITDLQYGAMDPKVMMSPRVAPQMIGLGLLEQIHPSDLLANTDPNDTNSDGISGKVSWVYYPGQDKQIGRFGHKASHATVRAQSAGAFAGDLGLSTPDVPKHWGECTSNQAACLAAPNGVQTSQGDTEVPDPILALVSFYSENLAVPLRRDVNDPDVLHGKELFYQTGCSSCHTPKYVTRRDAPNKAQQFQLIWPYSDLLLHDMGEGLADNRPVGDANGREWKTPPLWGIGLTKIVSGHTQFLHDGRARNLLEAILWHGSEAQTARDKVADMNRIDRTSLIRFLDSL